MIPQTAITFRMHRDSNRDATTAYAVAQSLGLTVWPTSPLTVKRSRMLVAICVLINLLSTASASDPPLSGPESIVREFCQRDFNGERTRSDTSARIEKLVLWEREPGWDTVTVVKSFRILSSRKINKKAIVVVEFDTLGEMPAWDFVLKREKERVQFTLQLGDQEWQWKNDEVVLVPGKLQWRITEPVLQPHISLPYSIEHTRWLIRTQADPKHELDVTLKRLMTLQTAN